MNTAAGVGSLVSTGMFGYLVDRYGNYDLPFVPMAVLLLTGAWLWLKVDPAERLILPAGEAATPDRWRSLADPEPDAPPA